MDEDKLVELQENGRPQQPKLPNTKVIPSVITLVAALLSCVISIYQNVEFEVFLERFFVVVLVFLFLSTIIKVVLDYAFRTLEEPKTIDDIADELEREKAAEEAPTEDGEVTEESNND